VIARAYLLGLLDLDQRLQVEREVLESDESYRHLLAAEEALISEYVCGVLVGTERRRFVRLFLEDPTRRERVEAAALELSGARGVRPFWGALATVLATVALALLLAL
jgi:anti-sigma-K factor RskA